MDNDLNENDKLWRETAAFFLRGFARELNEEVDIRGRGYGRFFLFQWALYLFALVRDIVRIPLHDPRGIGMARFRVRILYLKNTVRPALEFFRSRLPLTPTQLELLDLALSHLQQGEALLSDGPLPMLDEWYATMGEFRDLYRECQGAAEALDTLRLSLESALP